MSDRAKLLPKTNVGDIAHAGIRAALSTIPVGGGVATELFSLLLAPTLERRRDDFMEDLAEGFVQLEERVEGFNTAKLIQQDETFVSTMIRAARIAQTTHQKQKRRTLRNAVLNAALPGAPDDTLQSMFLGWLDAFSDWHIRLLVMLKNPRAWLANEGREPHHNWTWHRRFELIEFVFPELENKRAMYEQLCRDLFTRGLLPNGEGDGIIMLQLEARAGLTELGDEFLTFILEPSVLSGQ